MGENDKQIVNFDRICRLCLHEKRTLTEIFESTADNNNLSIDQKIMTCATIDLCKGDGLPSRICTKCLSCVNAAFDFRVQCENADRTLHDFLNKETDVQKEKTEINSTRKEDEEENEEEEDEEEFDNDKDKEEKTSESNFILTNRNNEIVPHNTILGENTENLYYILKDHDDDEEEEEEEEYEDDRESLDPYLTADVVYYGDENDPGGENEYCLQLRENYQHEKHYKVLIDHEAEYLQNDKKSYDSPNNNGEIHKSPCPFCHKMLTRVDEHIRLLHRNKIYVCTKSNCGAQFLTLKNLQSHQLNCFDLEKAYKCPYCNKEFHRKSNYKAHVKRHEDKKDFQCQLCDKAFVDSTGLRRHCLKHHEPEQKIYVSTCCGKRFRSKEGMKKHVYKKICGMDVEALQVINSADDVVMEDEIRG